MFCIGTSDNYVGKEREIHMKTMQMKRLLIVMTILFVTVLSAHANDLEPTKSDNSRELSHVLDGNTPNIAIDISIELIQIAKGK